MLLDSLKDEKVLIVCGQEIIKERNDGGKLCSYRNLELFQSVFGKENVFLIMFSKYKEIDKNTHIIRKPTHCGKINKVRDVLTGHMFTSAANEMELINFIKEKGIRFVVFERSMFGKIICKIKKSTDCRIGVFIHNIECQYFKNKLIHRGPLYFLPYLCVKKSEKRSIDQADYIMTLTERDSEILKRCYHVSSDIILPMTFKDKYDNQRERKLEKGKHLLFVGTMFPPNYDGIKWFVDQVMPELSDYKLKIVGKNFEKKRTELERKNVQVIGTVDDLEEYYYSNSVMVMPIFYGDGMKIKTAESFMYGRTIFASDEALEGYEVEGVKGIFRCNTKEEYINAIHTFFSEKNVRYYQEEVRNLFLKKYSFENQVAYCIEKWKTNEESYNEKKI